MSMLLFATKNNLKNLQNIIFSGITLKISKKVMQIFLWSLGGKVDYFRVEVPIFLKMYRIESRERQEVFVDTG